MNLHGIVAGAIGAVNPNIVCTFKVSTGFTVGADYAQMPMYTTFTNVTAQLQDLSQRDARQLDALNVQGSQSVIYVNGNYYGIVRVGQRGGDLVILPDGNTYLVTAVLELWPDWCKVSVTLQNGS